MDSQNLIYYIILVCYPRELDLAMHDAKAVNDDEMVNYLLLLPKKVE